MCSGHLQSEQWEELTFGLHAMRPYAVLGVMLLSLCGFVQVTSSDQCDASRDIQLVQTKCKEVNEAMLKAEQEHNSMELCRQVVLLLKCVATNVTRCFNFFHEMNTMYFHSPHNCELTADEVRELQQIHNNKTQVTVVPLEPSTSKTEKSTPTPITSTTQKGEAGSGGSGGHSGGEAKSGKKEEHKGTDSENGASSMFLSTSWLASLLFVSRALSWKLAS